MKYIIIKPPLHYNILLSRALERGRVLYSMQKMERRNSTLLSFTVFGHHCFKISGIYKYSLLTSAFHNVLLIPTAVYSTFCLWESNFFVLEIGYESAAARKSEDRWSAICDNRKWKYFNFILFFVDHVPILLSFRNANLSMILSKKSDFFCSSQRRSLWIEKLARDNKHCWKIVQAYYSKRFSLLLIKDFPYRKVFVERCYNKTTYF